MNPIMLAGVGVVLLMAYGLLLADYLLRKRALRRVARQTPRALDGTQAPSRPSS